MDFDQLTTFVFVAKLKSFSRAGQKVFRSQSAVSAQIRQLEQAYKARLLDRSAKSVELTPAGEVLFEYAEKLLRLRDESIQVVADRGNVVQGPVVFGANEATCLYLLPDIFAEFQRRYPLVHISIYRNFSHKILQRVEDGSVDVGIVTLPIKSPNLKMHHIYRDRLRFMVSTKNPLAHRSKITLAEVAEQPLIFPRTGFTRQVLDKLFRPYRARIHVTMELPSIGMIKRFVAADAGVSFISESFAKDYVKAGEVKLLTVEGVDLWRERPQPSPCRSGAHRHHSRAPQSRRARRSRRQLDGRQNKNTYSSRKAIVGSRLAARRAGSQHAIAEIRKKTTATVVKVTRSVAFTPTSIVVMPRVRANAATMPAATPIAVRRSPCPTIRLKIWPGPAPRVMRTPISAVRCRTTVARTP